MTKVSAIVSAYFAEEYIEGRLTNLLEQSLKPEVIVICQSGSKEHEIAKRFDVKIIETPDIPTIYEAWNMGVKVAEGEYLTNANCDDRLYPRALEKLAKALDDHTSYDTAYFNVNIVEAIDGAPIGTFEFMNGGLDDLVYRGCFMGPMPMWRKSIHDKIGYFEESYVLKNGDEYKPRIVSDYEFWMRMAKAGSKFFKIEQVLGAYLKRDNSLEHGQKLRHVWEASRARGKYMKEVVLC